MPEKISLETQSKIDTFTNILNVVLIILGGSLISIGIYYTINSLYDYLVKIGIMLIVAGVVSIVIGLFGFISHARIAKKMIKEAKMDYNY